jgi:MFS transporter, FHS family, Na+ dependent glucose transporter 1
MIAKWLVSTKNEAIRRTFGYYFLFVCLGLDTAIGGPTLPALANQTGSRIGQMGLLFLITSIGYTLGTMVGGRILDHVRGHPLMGIAQLVAAALIFTVPFVPWFWLLLAVLGCKGFAEGIINTGANALLVWTHKEKASPFMNGLHFFFGLGAFFSPFLVAQVIHIPGGYRWAYWILAGIALLAGLIMVTMKGNPRPFHPQQTDPTTSTRNPVPIGIVITAMLFLFFYVGAEITFGGWIYTYAVTLNLATVAGAAYLTSVFWLAFTIGRLISIPAATRFKPRQVLPVAILSCLAVLAVGIVFSNSSTVLWLMAIGLGFCMAPIWPTGFTLAGQSIHLTGRLTGIILLGDSLGGMVLPSAVGQIIESTGARTMVFLIFASLFCTLLAFLGLLRLRPAKPLVEVKLPEG